MSEDEEIILDEICTLSTSVDGLIQCLQSSSEKVNDNADTDMASPNVLVNLQSENVEEIDKVVLIRTSTTHPNDQEQSASSTSNVLQQQYTNNLIKVTLMTFM
jgi:cell division protein ZapA (FtsZ GTPase activity inhibitor)